MNHPGTVKRVELTDCVEKAVLVLAAQCCRELGMQILAADRCEHIHTRRILPDGSIRSCGRENKWFSLEQLGESPAEHYLGCPM